jgi:hypothetical protein
VGSPAAVEGYLPASPAIVSKAIIGYRKEEQE